MHPHKQIPRFGEKSLNWNFLLHFRFGSRRQKRHAIKSRQSQVKFFRVSSSTFVTLFRLGTGFFATPQKPKLQLTGLGGNRWYYTSHPPLKSGRRGLKRGTERSCNQLLFFARAKKGGGGETDKTPHKDEFFLKKEPPLNPFLFEGVKKWLKVNYGRSNSVYTCLGGDARRRKKKKILGRNLEISFPLSCTSIFWGEKNIFPYSKKRKRKSGKWRVGPFSLRYWDPPPFPWQVAV